MISSILLDHLFVALLAIVALYAVFVGQPQMKRVEGGFDAAGLPAGGEADVGRTT